MARGFEVCMRQDTRKSDGEYFAVVPYSYESGRGERYYLAIGSSDGAWAELSPQYLTRCTKTVTEFPEWLKKQMDYHYGYVLETVPRLKG